MRSRWTKTACTPFRRLREGAQTLDLFPLARPLLHRLDPERAHRLTLWGLRHGFGPRVSPPEDPALAQTLWGRRFPNPLGMAAGFDKDAEAIAPLLDMGFGFVEVGSITPRPQPGNPKPRVFRLPEDGAVINRYGFNSVGIDAVERNLRAFRQSGRGGIVGVNLGKNKDSQDAARDYAAGVNRLGLYADYLVVNVSSPNTPGLRALQSRTALEDLLGQVRIARDQLVRPDPPPVLLKIAPDLTEEDRTDIVDIALRGCVDGLIISNTTVVRSGNLRNRNSTETGGLSGRPLFAPSTALLREMYRRTDGQVPLVGVGGIDGPAAALEKIYAGASLLSLYTAFVYFGPSLVMNIINSIRQHLQESGVSKLSNIVGAGVAFDVTLY